MSRSKKSLIASGILAILILLYLELLFILTFNYVTVIYFLYIY